MRRQRVVSAPLQRGHQVGGALPALVGILGQTLLHDAIDTGGNAESHARQRLRIVGQDRRHHARRAASLERRHGRTSSRRESRRARRCPSARRPRAPSTCSGAMYGIVPRTVPCSVNAKALRGRFDGVRRLVPQFRQPEIEELHAARREHDVARLQIPMNHAFPVRGVERRRDLAGRQASAVSTESGPRSRRSASVSPSRSSMTRNGTPSNSPTS